MGDEEDRAVEVEEPLLEELERLDVEVVGRLVEDQEVRRLREEAREEEAVALAAGEGVDRRARARGAEEEVLEEADHVPALAADVEELAALGHVLEHRLLGLELQAELVEVGDLELRPEPHAPAIGRELAEQDAEQRRLAGAVRADEADAVAAQDAEREVAARSSSRRRHGTRPPPRRRASRTPRPRRSRSWARPWTSRRRRRSSRSALERAHAALVPGAARLDPAPDPRLLLRELLVEERLVARLLLERGGASSRGSSGSRRATT